MIAALRWIRLVVVVAVCAGVAVGAYLLAGYSWDAVVEYESPYARMPMSPSAESEPTVDRTVLVIIDGLRLDASREMGTLNLLRGHGADLVLTAPQPSLSYPNWTTILSGAPPYVSGVVTNWHEGQSPVETLFDTAASAGVKTVFVGPTDFETLYGAGAKADISFMKDWSKKYLSDVYVDEALRLAKETSPGLLIVHLPDIDEAGHSFGGASEEYATMVARVDADLGRLVNGLQDGSTDFVIVADHGHLDTGGHGGWEAEVTEVPGVFAGPGIVLGSRAGDLGDVAATVSVLTGAPVPQHSAGLPLAQVVGELQPQWPALAQSDRFWREYGTVVGAPADSPVSAQGPVPEQVRAWALQWHAAADAAARVSRLPITGGAVLACVLVLVTILVGSRPAFIAALAGTAAYYLVYNAAFFLLHGNRWSLSSFNSEDRIGAWMNERMIEAAIALLIGAAVAAVVYPLVRHAAYGPYQIYLPGWLTLGPTTALFVLATLGIQVAWFYWWFGIEPVLGLPDLQWAFKYDLDLVQMTAVGAAAVLAPLVTYHVGRYHPKVRPTTPQE